MITAFDVYMFMIADSVSTALTLLAILFGLAAFGCGIAWAIHHCDHYEAHAEKWRHITLRIAVPIAVTFWLAATFFPNTKTVAAMIIVPKLTSAEVTGPLSAEASELYTMAKQALKQRLQQEQPREDAPR